ncbi:MAG: PAS domain S-box protein [Actinobacteria bacterium]|nr:PAS domain S-box protein [Actinomycetota bacterium]MBU1943931.1 PAS domain S-box protein [Actinomycetota bacterium]MBU2686981.1 PAS domain S-box protein [Actinomycetota bacterium]
MSKTTRPQRLYVWSLIAIFVAAELCLIGIDLYYLIAKDETLASFFADVALTTSIILVLLLLGHLAMRRVLAGLVESERRFRELADQLPQAVVESDTRGNITYANRLALEWFGYNRQDMESGRLDPLSFVPEEEREKMVENFKRARAGTLSGTRSYTAMRKDGSAFPVLVASSPIVRDGKVVGLRGVLSDVTEQKQVEDRVRASERKYRELADSLPQVVFEMDTDGNISYTNANAFTIFGYDDDAVARGMNVRDVMADPVTAMKDIGLMVRFKVPEIHREYVARRRDGSTFPVVISARLVLEEGEPVGIRGIVTDITEQKRREQEYERANAELLGYAHTVSHDLKNPLHDVTMAAYTFEQLLERPLSAEIQVFMDETLAAMKSGLERANHLIDDLLMLAESGQVPKEVIPVDVSEKVDEILAERSNELEIRGVTVRRDEELGSIVASPTHIYQVFSNLIKNAIVYNDSVEPVLEIKALEPGDSGGHRFLVRDNGPGITPDLLDSIFVPFTRGEAGDTGIGLSIVEKITRVYGGEVTVFNDGGACFELLLYDWGQT